MKFPFRSHKVYPALHATVSFSVAITLIVDPAVGLLAW